MAWNCDREGSGWVSGRNSSIEDCGCGTAPQGIGHGTELARVQGAFGYMVWFSGDSVWRQELVSVILMDLLLLVIFHESSSQTGWVSCSQSWGTMKVCGVLWLQLTMRWPWALAWRFPLKIADCARSCIFGHALQSLFLSFLLIDSDLSFSFKVWNYPKRTLWAQFFSIRLLLHTFDQPCWVLNL